MSSSGPISDPGVHCAEDFGQHLVSIGAAALAVLVYRSRKQSLAVENVGVLGEEAEYQPCHEMVHVQTARVSSPIRVLAQQFHVQLVQPARGAHVNGVVLDLLDGGDARQRQEEAEVVGEVRIRTGYGFATSQFLGLQRLTVGRKDELALAFAVARAGTQCLEGLTHRAGCAHRHVDVVALEHASRYIR